MEQESLIARIDRIESTLAIQQLACRYARAIDSRNIAEIVELFAPETNWGEDGIGTVGARTFYERVLADFYRSFHQISGHVIEITGDDTAKGTVCCRAEHEVAGSWILNLMVYFDRYVRRDGKWHFLGRRARYLYVGDALIYPGSVDFNHWPGREGAFKIELPQSDATWEGYWSERIDQRDRLTHLP